MKIVLDTNACSDWRRSGRWGRLICKAEQVWLPSVVMGELWHGFLEGEKLQENRLKLQTFLAERCVEVLQVGAKTAQYYGEFLWHLKKNGTPIPTNDIWIAAMSYEAGGTLATADCHFSHLPQLSLAVE